MCFLFFFFFSSRRRHTRFDCDWSSDVCSSDLEHKESAARQYALADLAVALGWPRDRVEVVDADQGRSGQTAEGRRGFQYLLAELGLDHVGIVLGLEASRLARSDPDWTPLVRSCGLFRALLGDYDGL